MWEIEPREDRILVRPIGRLEMRPSEEAAQRFRDELAHRDRPSILIIDLQQLKGYETGVRELWQATIKDQRDRISRMVWISGNPLFRMVAASVSLFTGIPGSVLDSYEEAMTKVF